MYKHQTARVDGHTATALRDFLDNTEKDGWECCGITFHAGNSVGQSYWTVVLKMEDKVKSDPEPQGSP